MKYFVVLNFTLIVLLSSCKDGDNVVTIDFPNSITIKNVAQNPEGIEFDENDNTFLLSSLNATPILKVNLDGTYENFTSGEAFPLSTAGLEIDNDRNRLLVAGFNGTELLDGDSTTVGTSYLRIYNLETGIIEQDINLSSEAPNASSYFANDIAVDNAGNAYISDWYAGVIYKVETNGTPSLFWTNDPNNTGVFGGPNGLDFHPDGYLLVSLLNVDQATGLYIDYGLVKIPVNAPETATLVEFSNTGYTGFDGMVLTSERKIIGVSNNGTAPSGNVLLELESVDNWENANVINSKVINASTTVAITPENLNYVINQDFTDGAKETWTIERIEF